MKKTVVIGASPETSRYSNLVCRMLDNVGIEFVPVGIRKGEIMGKQILSLQDEPDVKDVHTLTLYLNPSNQKQWYDYILKLQPRRLIFNPGTENPELAKLAKSRGIETEFACNLVLIQTGQF